MTDTQTQFNWDKYPRHQCFTETVKKTEDLTGQASVTVHFKNYKRYKDHTDYYILKGDKMAWYGVSLNFRADYLCGKVKDQYTDQFGRTMTVKKIQ